MEFRQKIPFDLTIFPYRLRTIQNSEELKAVLDLRKLCFEASIDKWTFDFQADHLVVFDLEKNILCGTYRLSHSDFCNSFECQEDFHLESLLQKNGAKIELAWACIHPDCRHGSILALLWRGLSEIIKTTNTKYIFGQTSVRQEASNIALIQHSLQSKELPIPIRPKREHNKELKSYQLSQSAPTKSVLRKLIPGILRAYLMAGALVCSQPSYDADLNCYDFMTVIDVDQVSDSFGHHYNI